MIRLVISYFIWHYTRAFRDMVEVFGNFLWFVYHFFSIPVLIQSLFSPWIVLRSPDFAPINFLASATLRILALVLRLFIITFGLLTLLVVLIVEALVFVAWVFLPLIILVLFISGVRLMFK